ncbi:hypothetical protein P7C70_g6677, partial [Phenoliferia sp. Uapishka_3]
MLSQDKKEYYRQHAELRQKAYQNYKPEEDDDLMVGGKPSLAFKDLLARADRIEAAERAIMNKRRSEEELEKIFPRRTAPWIASCTADEARERAQLLRDEYDKFLAVLFGRKIPISRPNLEKRGYYAPNAWKATREFGMGPILKDQDEDDVPNEASPLQIIIDLGIKTPDEDTIFLTNGSGVEYEGFIKDASELLSEDAMAEVFNHGPKISEKKNEKIIRPSTDEVKQTSQMLKSVVNENATKTCEDRLKIPQPFDVEAWLAQDDDQIGNREEIENSRVAWRKYCADGEAERRRTNEINDPLEPTEFGYRVATQLEDALIEELGLKLGTTELTSNLVEWLSDSDFEGNTGYDLGGIESSDESTYSGIEFSSNMVLLQDWGVQRTNGSSILRTRRPVEESDESDENDEEPGPYDHGWETDDSMPSLMSASEDESEDSEGRTSIEITAFENQVREYEAMLETDSEGWESDSEGEFDWGEDPDTSYHDSRERLLKMMNETTYSLNNAELEFSDEESTSESSGKDHPFAKTSARERMYGKPAASPPQ